MKISNQSIVLFIILAILTGTLPAYADNSNTDKEIVITTSLPIYENETLQTISKDLRYSGEMIEYNKVSYVENREYENLILYPEFN